MENTFILRTPLLRLNNLVLTEEELLKAYENTVIKEALFVASKDLYGELMVLDQIIDESKREKIVNSLYKYYTRMCTRSTPFGLFSGINLGYFSDVTEVKLKSSLLHKVRLDMDFLCNLYYDLNTKEEIYQQLKFFPNNTLYKVNEQWRYVEYNFKVTTRYHNLVSIDDNELVSKIIEICKEGEDYAVILEIIKKFGFEEDESKNYIHNLVQSQVLNTNLYPSVTGIDYQERLFDELDKINIDLYTAATKSIETVLNSNDNLILKTKHLENILSQLPININSNKLLQVDLLKEAETCFIDKSVKKKIEEATKILAALSINNRNNTLLERFKIAFYERYEDKFMPLTHVLDTDIGIAYKNPITVAQLGTPNSANAREKKIKGLKFKLYKEAIKSNLKSVEILKSDLADLLDHNPTPCSPTYSFLGNIFLNNNNEISVRYKLASGGSAVNLIARFGHMHEEIENFIQSIADNDQAQFPNCVVAEIVHLPQGRLGNVVTRKQFRKYEIPYLGYSTLPNKNQITVDDLYVGIINHRIVLYSKKLQKEIIPRLGNAHNFSFDGLPIYHFLADLQTQNFNGGIFWSWGELYDEANLPRVTFKNIILSPRRWKIDTENLRKFYKNNNFDAFFKEIDHLDLPYQFLIIEADNELYIDLKSPIGISTFYNFCSKRPSIIIEEFLFNDFQGIDGFSNEVIIPFSNNALQGNTTYDISRSVNINPIKQQIFTPLSEWVYFKIYTGKKFADVLLLEIIPLLLEDLNSKNIISKWFFIRYADPKDHLRIRFLITKDEKRLDLEKRVKSYLDVFIRDNLIWDIQIATYNRELNRYGIDVIEECETWFCHNSELVLNLIEKLQRINETDSILYLPFFIDSLLNQFNLEIDSKLQFSKKYAEGFMKEFGLLNNKNERNNLNDQFRSIHPKLHSLLLGDDTEDETMSDIKSIFNYTFRITDELVKEIIDKDNAQKLEQIINSFIHMFANRLFNTDQRYKEMIGYYFLQKYYASIVARSKNLINIVKNKYGYHT